MQLFRKGLKNKMQEDLQKAKEIIQKQKEEQSAKLKKIKKNKTLR